MCIFRNYLEFHPIIDRRVFLILYAHGVQGLQVFLTSQRYNCDYTQKCQEEVALYIEEIHLVISLSSNLLPLIPKSELVCPIHNFVLAEGLIPFSDDDQHWHWSHPWHHSGAHHAVSGQWTMESVSATADGQ